MKLKVELNSNELENFVKTFMRENRNEEVSYIHCHWGYLSCDEFEELVKRNYCKVTKTFYNLNPNIEYRSDKTDGKQTLDRETINKIIGDFVAKEYKLRVTSISYGMLVDDDCISQIENPLIAYKITGKTIAECEVEKINAITLESTL
jgi:hypothetical protein